MLDDFTSVLDRTAALSLASDVQRFIAQHNMRRVVVVSCHTDFLRRNGMVPDWFFETHSGRFVVLEPDLKPAMDGGITRIEHTEAQKQIIRAVDSASAQAAANLQLHAISMSLGTVRSRHDLTLADSSDIHDRLQEAK